MRGYENGGDVKRKTLYGGGGDKDEGSIEYDDDSYKYKRILSILADQVGGGEGLYGSGKTTFEVLTSQAEDVEGHIGKDRVTEILLELQENDIS